MESPRKNNDCYFYYYSTCTKGDSCTFRHEPSALGCETVCSFWKEGKCLNVHCSFRHMELRKNRKAIPCYWEMQPGGCLKEHCPFLHKNRNGECETLGVSDMDSNALSAAIGQSSSQGMDIDRNQNLPNQYSDAKYGNATVDPLVVKFEEESDNESAPTNSPAKSNQTRVVKVKTLEEIRLEKIQAESAAYYFYPGAEQMVGEPPQTILDDSDDLRQRIINRLGIKTQKPTPTIVGLLSLDQIRKRKLYGTESENEPIIQEHKKHKISLTKSLSQNLGDIKIKTLEEIREERLQRLKQDVDETKSIVEEACPEVSSTSTEEVIEELRPVKPLSKIVKPARRLKRKAPITEVFPRRKLRITQSSPAVKEDTPPEPSVNNEQSEPPQDQNTITNVETHEQNELIDRDNNGLESQYSSSKLDDMLLLDDDDMDDSNISFKAEDDILKEIDDLLNE